tara:strand:- start:186 stop:506 length:321 start_codon:yes stop_codon:yes gene_type:complete
MNFQKIVITIAVILLILSLAFIGTAINSEKKNIVYPPVIAECPDYWKHDIENNKCINENNLGNAEINEFDLNIVNKLPLCDKFKLSKQLKIFWDGISNNAKLINKC